MMNYGMPYTMPMHKAGCCSNYGMDFTREALCISLNLIKEAVEDEKSDQMFYDYLMSKAPTKEEKEIIKSIKKDEKKHAKWFKEIYKCYTGIQLKENEDSGDYEKPKSYIDGIKKAIFGELKAMEKYRVIRQGIPSRCYRDMVLTILTDEMKHAIKYNYILNINPCKCKKRFDVRDSDSSIDRFSGNEMRRIMW